MHEVAEFLLAIGSILLLGLTSDFLGRHTFLPRVSLLLVFGIIVGDEVLGLVPQIVTDRFDLIANLALLMIGFLLGGRLTYKSLIKDGRKVIWISISAAIVTTLIVTLASLIIGMPLEVSILLGCIAAATDAIATFDTVIESESKSVYSRLLLAIVAIDDAWALIFFSMGLAVVTFLDSTANFVAPVIIASREILGGLLLGGLIGLPAAYLTGRLKSGQPILTEALGLVFLCGGAAIWLDVSFLIASMAMGAVIANFAKHHDYPFHEIENIEWPFMALFFVLAGASLDISMLPEMGLVGMVYLLARVSGKYIGASLGAQICHTNKNIGNWMGLGLMPQAGVAIGMALLTASKYPEYRQIILSVIISTTVFFELVGPVLTRTAIKNTEKIGID